MPAACRYLACFAILLSLGCMRSPTPTRSFPRADDFLAQETVDPYTPYAQRRATHRTKLSLEGAAVLREWDETPVGARLVRYQSSGLWLRGWLFVPDGRSAERLPAVVYLHNDFALTQLSWSNARAFRDAGFVVFLPSLRAENGNPGDFELLYGEVDDAENAVKWLVEQPEVDPAFVYVIGHSIGGGIASLLNLRPDLPVRRTASIGGTYRARTLHVWALQPETEHLIRFDLDNPAEVQLRLLIPNLPDMTRPHIVYAGEQASRDTAYARHASDLAAQIGAPLEFVSVSGDHLSSAKPAVAHFTEVIRRDVTLNAE